VLKNLSKSKKIRPWPQGRNEKTYYGGAKIFLEGSKRTFGGQKYTKYNKITIQKNSEG